MFKCSECVNFDFNELGRIENTNRYEANNISAQIDKCPYCWNRFLIGFYFSSEMVNDSYSMKGGPVWNKPINDFEFIESSVKTLKDHRQMLGYFTQKQHILNLFNRIIEVSINYFLIDFALY